MELIYHGHSFIEIKIDQGSVLIDPFITENPKCDISVDDCLEKDLIAICVTHWHTDHIGNTVQLAKKTWAEVISTFELAKYFVDTCGLENVHKMHIGGKYECQDFDIKVVQAVHGGGIASEGKMKNDRMKVFPTKPCGFVFSLDNKTIYHAGDTALTYDMKLLSDMDIDVAFLPIGDNFTMGIDDACKAVDFIQSKRVVPIHFDTWPVIEVDSNKFAKKVLLEDNAKPKVLNPGQLLALDSDS